MVETGAQVRAAIALVERLGSTVAGIAAIHVDPTAAASEFAYKYTLYAASAESD